MLVETSVTSINNSIPVSNDISEENAIQLSLSDYLHTLWLRRKLFVSTIVFILLISALTIFQLVPRYTATTQLLVGINAAKVVDIEQVLSGSMSGDSAVIGEIEVIKSRDLARKVIEALALDQYEEFNPDLKEPGFLSTLNPVNWLPEGLLESLSLKNVETGNEEDIKETKDTQLINRFLKKLTVTQVKRSQVINIAYESENPKLAAKIANTIADKYIVGQLQAKFDATKKATDWLNDQLDELKEKVKNSEHAVQDFRRLHNLTEVSKETSLSQQQLSEINSQLFIARAQRAEAEAKYQQVEAITRTGKDVDSVAEVLNSQLITMLRQQESEVQRKYSEMLVEFGPRHPKMVQMHAELDDIKAKVLGEVKKISAGLRNSMEVARVREGSLQGSLRQLEVKNSGNNQDEVQLRALEREATANKTLFETFLGRFKETTSTQGIEQADARVISVSEVPLMPSYPKKDMMLGVCVLGAVFFAFFLVFVLEQLNPGVRSPEQVQDLFNVTTLGIIPKTFNMGNLSIFDYLLQKPQSALSEAINTLRISLTLLNPDSEVKSILVTSSVPAEGKSTLATLIARHSAQSGQRVVLLEADLRKPAVAKHFGCDKDTLGITDLLSNHDLKVEDVLVNDDVTGLKILARGKIGYVNPIDLFASKRMKAIVDDLRERYDLVIVDSAPVMAVPDARILQGLVDKTIFVVNWDNTPKKVIKNALHLLSKDGHSNIAGIVIQKVDFQQYGRYGYGDSGYYYHYGRYNHYYTH